MRTREELEKNLEMTDDEVEHYFPGAINLLLAKVLQKKHFITENDKFFDTMFRCDDRDLHATIVINADEDRYANLTYHGIKKNWAFSF